MKKTNLITRILALSLTLAVSLPNSAFALRQRGPSIGTPVNTGLEEALRSGAVSSSLVGLEEYVPVENAKTTTYPAAGMEEGDWLNRAVFSLLRASLNIAARVRDWYSGYRILGRHKFFVYSVVFSPDRQTLVSGSADETVQLWDVATGRKLWPQPFKDPGPAHQKGVMSVAFHPGGQMIAVWLIDGTLWLLDAKSGKPLEEGHPNRRSVLAQRRGAMAFSPDGNTIVTGGDKGLQWWDMESDQPVRVVRDIGEVYSVAINRDGKVIAGGERIVWLYDKDLTESPKTLTGFTGTVEALAFDPVNPNMVVSGSSGGAVQLLDVETGRLQTLPLEGPPNGIRTVSFSPDGKKLAAAGLRGVVHLWDMGADPVKEISGLDSRTLSTIFSLAWSPDGKTLASAHGSQNKEKLQLLKSKIKPGDNVVRLWTVPAGLEEPTLVQTPFAQGLRLAGRLAALPVRVWVGLIRVGGDKPGLVASDERVPLLSGRPEGMQLTLEIPTESTAIRSIPVDLPEQFTLWLQPGLKDAVPAHWKIRIETLPENLAEARVVLREKVRPGDVVLLELDQKHYSYSIHQSWKAVLAEEGRRGLWIGKSELSVMDQDEFVITLQILRNTGEVLPAIGPQREIEDTKTRLTFM